MKVGIELSIDVTKIDKARLYEGKKGKYLTATTFVDLDNVDQYDNNGFIAEKVSKDEQEAGTKGTILGNVKVFWKGEGQAKPQGKPQPSSSFEDDLSDIPF